MRHYKLVDHKPVLVEDLMEWAAWFETAQRHVAHDQIAPRIRVSTIFLGLDHNFVGAGLPILFETMVFGGLLDGLQERYHTWEEAEKGHAIILAQVKEKEGGGNGNPRIP